MKTPTPPGGRSRKGRSRFTVGVALVLASLFLVSIAPRSSYAFVTGPNGFMTGEQMVYDPANKEMLVSCSNGNSICAYNTANSLVATITPPTGPGVMIYDPANGYVYTSVGYVIDPTNSVIQTISLNNTSGNVVYDPANNDLYFTSQYLMGEIEVFSPAANKVVAQISTPEGWEVLLGYDQSNGNMYLVTGGGCGVLNGPTSVSVISSSTNRITTTIQLTGVGNTGCPTDVQYDPSNGDMYVLTELNGIFEISSATNTIASQFNVDWGPKQMVYASNGYFYIATFDGTVDVVVANTNTMVTSMSINYVYDMTYDQKTGYLYVLQDNIYVTGPGAVIVVDTSSNKIMGTVTTGTNPTTIGFDPASKAAYVLNQDSSVSKVVAVTFSASPSSGGSVSPSGVGFYILGSQQSIVATHSSGYTFSKWTTNNPYITILCSTCSSAQATISGSGTITANFASTLSISITQSGTTLYWHISGLTPYGTFTVSESTSQGFTDFFSYTASSTGTDSRAFNYGGGTAGDVVSLTVTDSATGRQASTSYTVQSVLSISITQSGSTLYWHISGLTPNGAFTVSEKTSQGFTDYFSYTASSSGTDSRAFNYGGGTAGDVITLTVTDSSTGRQASTSYTLQ